jgi:hypothetical protein
MPMTWDAFKEGDEIPVLKKKPGVTQLVKYAAGGGDFNPLHHDYGFPRFKYAALGELVSNWLDHGGRIQKISCQYRGMDKPDLEMTLGGKVVKKYEQGGKKLADLELWVKNEQGTNTTPGSATVRIDR